jgi:hypothetical protein
MFKHFSCNGGSSKQVGMSVDAAHLFIIIPLSQQAYFLWDNFAQRRTVALPEWRKQADMSSG